MNMHPDPQDQEEPLSKSERKRAMHELQALGSELVELNAQELARIELPEELREAIAEAQRIRDFEGKRRQMQYIGKLMRSVDAAPIRAQLAQLRGAAQEHTELHQSAERWRERLLADANELPQFAASYPGADTEKLAAVISSVKHDRAQGRTPKRYRELFRMVIAIIEQA